MASFHGRVPEFSGATDDWDIFTEQLSHYFTASGITAADKKRAVLLSTCGTIIYKLLKTLVSPDDLTSKTFDELVKLVQDHHHPQPSVIMRRFRFNTCVRQQGETVAAFVTRLRDLASHCEYGDSAKELIRDRLVCGIRNDHMQRGLLEVAKLTFEKAFEMALLHEAAEQNSRALNAPLDVHRTSTSIKHRPRPTDRTTDRATTACYRCGGRHLANDCRFRSSVCNYCKKKGHIQRVCRSRLRQTEHREGSNEREPKRDAQRRDRDRDRAHRVDDETEPPPPEPNPRQVDYNMFVVCTNRVAPFTVRVEVEGAPLWMEIDTGAALSLISKTTYSQLWSEGRAPTLEKLPIRLRTYTGEELKLVGKAVVKVCVENQEEVLDLLVVEGSGPSLLGRDWLSKIQLNWKEIHKVHTKQASLEEILTDHSNLFKDELGTIKGTSAKLHINPDTLSRLPLPDHPKDVPLPGEMVLLFETLNSSPLTAAEIRSLTDKDPLLSRVRSNVLRGWHDTDQPAMRPYQSRSSELSVQDGCLLWGSRVVIPPRGRAIFLSLLHEGHPGITRMKTLARGYVWWPSMDSELEDSVKRCSKCQEHQRLPAKAPMHPWEWPDRPWARIHVDYAGPIEGKMVLIMVDAHSRWLEALVVNSATSQTTIEKLRSVFATHRLPEVLVSDNGSVFTSAEFDEFVRRNGIKHLTSAPYHPASNGLAERAVQTVKIALKKATTGTSLETRISRFLFQYRLTPHTTTGVSPAKLLMNRRPHSRLDLLHPDVSSRVRDRQGIQKANHDCHTRQRKFVIGESVSVRNQGTGPPWLPGTITSMVCLQRCVVLLSDGRSVERHIDHMRHRVGGESTHSRSSIRPPHDEDDPGHREPAQPLTGYPTPQPRRSTRVRRPPDRLM